MTPPASERSAAYQLSIDICCRRCAQQQTNRTPLLLSIDGTDSSGGGASK